MANTVNKKKTVPVTKPFLRGAAFDNSTVRRALSFFGLLLMFAFVSVIMSSMLMMDNTVIRVGLNMLIELMILMFCFNNGSVKGNDDTARGETMYQRSNDGQEIAKTDRDACFNTYKGWVAALIGSVLLFVLAVILSLTAKKVMTGAGVLPDWLNVYQRRSAVGNALTAYNQQGGVALTDIVRTVIRMDLIPFVSAAGSENKDLLLLIDRISPILVLLPALAYGAGYLQGPGMRSKVHTQISENQKKRKRREIKARKARAAKPRGPEQLN